MQQIKWAMLVVLVLIVSACGGGGGSSGSGGGGNTATSISVSDSSLSFSTYIGDGISQSRTVNVTYKGDGVLVGFPVGVNDPGWIFVDQLSATNTTASFSVSVIALQEPGTYTTTLRFITGKQDGSSIVYKDVAVTYIVKQHFGANMTGSGEFTAKMNQSIPVLPAEGYALAVVSEGAWTITTDTPWLSFSRASGVGSAQVMVSATMNGAVYGTNNGTFTVKETASNEARTFNLQLQLVHAQPVIDNDGVAFTINAKTKGQDLQQVLLLSDENQGQILAETYQWSLKSVSVPWLSLSAQSGTTQASEQVLVQVDKPQLAGLNQSIQSGQIVLTVSNDYEAARDYTINVSMEVNLPVIDFVSPYIALEDRAGKAILRGRDFPVGETQAPVLMLGDHFASSVFVDSANQIRFDYAGLPSGDYYLSLDNELGVELPAARLVVVAAEGFPKDSIPAPSRRDKLVLDAERKILYGLNSIESIVERYEYKGSEGWVKLSGLVVPQLRDITLTPTGEELLIASNKNIYTVNLTDQTQVLQLRATLNDDWCGIYLSQLMALNDGTVVVGTQYSQCSGSTVWRKYSLITHSFMEESFYHIYNGLGAVTGNGARIYFGENGLSPAQPMRLYDTLSNEILGVPVNYNINAISSSMDGARVILQDTDVYSGSLVLLGYLPYGGVSLVSHDGTKAYMYRDDNDNPRIEVYNLQGALLSGAMYPLIDSIALEPVLSNQGYLYHVRLVESLDGKTLFVSGDLRIAVEKLD